MKAQSRLQQFRKQIRRSQIDQIKRRLRIEAESQITIHDLAATLKLQPNLSYSLGELLELRQKCLGNPPLSQHKIQEEWQLSIQAHIRFWKFLSEKLNKSEEVWSPKIWTILSEIMNGYSYQQIHHCVSYQLHFLNTLQLACERIGEDNKIQVLSWIAGPEGLRVVESCLRSGQFLDCEEHSRIYKIIQLGLKSELRQESEEAAIVLTKILQGADWDDAYKIYQRFHGLMIHLCCKIERCYLDGATKSYSLALNLLLDCYDEVVIDYARSGAAYSAALLVTSPHLESQAEGLNLLRTMSQVDSPKIAELLLANRDIEACRLFEGLFTRSFARHPSSSVRQLFYSFLENLLANSSREQAESINRRFDAEYRDVFELLSESLKEQLEGLILKSTINSLRSLAYYGQREDKPNELLPLLENREILKGLEVVAHSELLANEVVHMAIELLNQLSPAF